MIRVYIFNQKLRSPKRSHNKTYQKLIYLHCTYTLYVKCVENDSLCSGSSILFNLPPNIRDLEMKSHLQIKQKGKTVMNVLNHYF